MSSNRATRLAGGGRCQPFDWTRGGLPAPPPFGAGPDAVATTVAEASPRHEAPDADVAFIERDAFAKGFAQGERAGAEAAATRAETVLRRLAQTIEELQRLRGDILQKSEREVVRLAVAIAKRVVHREVSLDPELLTAMARVALDRLGESASATIRLHPEDFAATTAGRHGGPHDAGPIRVVADPTVRRGGCHVHSDFGLIDVSPDAQIAELATALLGDDATADVPVEARLAS